MSFVHPVPVFSSWCAARPCRIVEGNLRGALRRLAQLQEERAEVAALSVLRVLTFSAVVEKTPARIERSPSFVYGGTGPRADVMEVSTKNDKVNAEIKYLRRRDAGCWKDHRQQQFRI